MEKELKKVDRIVKTIGFILCLLPMVVMFAYANYAINNANLSFEEFRGNLLRIGEIGLISGFMGMIILPVLGGIYYVCFGYEKDKQQLLTQGNKNEEEK